jgi:RsiW-degrading membrane proteinase PrsW (M82 family)
MADEAPETPASPTPATSAPAAGRLRRLLFGTPVDAVLHISLLLAAVVFLLSLPYFTRDGSEEFVEDVFQHGYVFVWLMAVTVLGRTLPLRMLAAFFFLGLFASVLIVQSIGNPLGDLAGTGRVLDSLLAPLLEEGVKVVPVALVFWILVRRGWQPSITDGLLLGFVLGAGMAIHEDALYGRVYGAGTGDSTLGILFPTIGNQSTLSRVEVYGFFHSGWGSLTGLAIGASFLLRRFRWAPLIAIAAYVVVVIDHGIGNFIIENRSVAGLGLLWTLNLDGRLPIYLLILGIAAAVAGEVLIQRRLGRADRVFVGLSPGSVLPSLGDGFAGLLRVQASRVYVRARRALHYLLWADRGMKDPGRLLAQTLRVEAAAREAGVPIQLTGVKEKK